MSAYAKGVRRPAFEDLKKVVAAGQVDGVLVWKLDRLVRRASDFERFWGRCDQADVFLASATEPIDSTTELGLAVIRILVTFASVESTSFGLRMRARMEEKARAGIPLVHGREFGFDEHWDRIVEEEAALLREAADRFLAGEALDAIADDWRRRRIRPLRGTEWTRRKLTRILTSPRIAGDNSFNGVVVARGCFPAILDPLTFAQVRSRLAAKSTGSTSRSYLLSSGLLRCGICGARMHGSTYKSRAGSRLMQTKGSWTIATTVPATIIGPAMLAVRCNGPTRQFNTPSIPVYVTTPFRVQVTPTSFRRGQSVTVTAIGPGCGEIATPDIYLWRKGNSTWGIAETVGQTGGQPPWTLTLKVPVTAAPGQYFVVARCDYSRAFTRTYQPVAVRVGS